MRYLAIGILLFAINASASTILISDIDDTVRQTNSRNLGTLAVLKNQEFAGLSKLYSHLKSSVSEVNYVTGNPRPLKYMVQYFLNSNKFPLGAIFARDTKFDTITHKVNAIEGIILGKNPDQLIMLGDNGEQDPISYETIARSHPGMTTILMHQIVDEEINPNQIAWMTSIDLAAIFYANGVIGEKAFDEVLDFTLPMLSSTQAEAEKVFPAWGQCRLFFKNYQRVDARFTDAQNKKLDKFEQFMLKRCS